MYSDVHYYICGAPVFSTMEFSVISETLFNIDTKFVGARFMLIRVLLQMWILFYHMVFFYFKLIILLFPRCFFQHAHAQLSLFFALNKINRHLIIFQFSSVHVCIDRALLLISHLHFRLICSSSARGQRKLPLGCTTILKIRQKSMTCGLHFSLKRFYLTKIIFVFCFS